MNIGMFTDSFFPQISGVSTSIKTLADQLEKQGHRVYIFTTTDPQVKKEQYGVGDEKSIYRFSSIPYAGFKDRRVTYRGFFEAVEIAKNLRLDIVHTHTEFSLGLIGRFVARQLKIPHIHTYHTMYQDYTHYLLNGRLINANGVARIVGLFLKNVDGVIAPSQRVYQVLKSYGVHAPIRVIPTGVNTDFKPNAKSNADLRRKYKLSNGQTIILSLGRVAFEKNLNELIDAFYDLHFEYPNIKLMIAGDGPAMEDLVDQVKKLKIEDHVIFTGMVDHDQVNNYYAMADLFVSASTSETQGLTFVEALVAQTPFVAAKSDYLDDVITGPSVGKEFENFEELKKDINFYLKNPKYKSAVKARNQAIRKISAETFGRNVEEFYDSIISHYINASKKSTNTTLRLNRQEIGYALEISKRISSSIVRPVVSLTRELVSTRNDKKSDDEA